MSKIVRCRVLDAKDNVGIVLEQTRQGDLLSYESPGSGVNPICAFEDIPAYHKYALKTLDQGDNVFKYGQIIGRATMNIQAGQHVHSHNLTSMREDIANNQ
ncbi:UxaA family hydrolase [Desulfosporosinus sp. SB140]|uniref:UxaA family hydrolase n=1 Tax=Desulfosporosinus paludis TaxID=3115649 RepID=UPI00388E25F7